MATANSSEVEYNCPIGYESGVQTETIELDRRTIKWLDALRENDGSYDELVTELTSIFATSELSATRVDSPLIE